MVRTLLELEWVQSAIVLTVFYFSLPVRGSVWWPCSNECARCLRQTTALEDLLLQYYPGLFSALPPPRVFNVAGTAHLSGNTNTLFSRAAQIRNSSRHRNHQHSSKTKQDSDPSQNTTNLHLVPETNAHHSHSRKHVRNQTEGTTARWHHDAHARHPSKSVFVSRAASVRRFPKVSSPSPCCETIQEYVTPPNVTVEGKVYRVVHLRRAFQFIPVAKCRQGTSCSHGECVERYRAHWVLVYNATKSHAQPPVSFTTIEVPSHCECLNIGRS